MDPIDSAVGKAPRGTIYRRLTKLCGGLIGDGDTVIEEYTAQLQACMYQYSRAIYRSIRDLIDPYVAPHVQLEYRRAVLEQCELTMERLAKDPLYFAITAQAEVAWAVQEGVAAAVAFIEEQIEAGALDGGVARCKATTRKGKPCQRTPLPERDYCPSHQHLERSKVAA